MNARPLLLFLFTALALRTDAQILGARPFTPPPGARPAAGGPSVTPSKTAAATAPATLSQRRDIQDGATVTVQIMTFARNAALEIESFRLNDWKRAESPQHAMLWNNWFNAQIHLGINYVTGPAARSLVDGTGWSNVPTGIRREAKDTVRVLVNDDSETNTDMIRIFGWRTRVYHYEIIPAVAGTPPQSQLVVVAGDDNRAYLFTLEGSTSQVNNVQDSFATILTRLQPAGPNP